MDFDTENFICEIKKRPALWDNRCADYTDKNIKVKQWDELVVKYGGNELTLEEKKTLGQTLQKKWKNIRDCFVKESRKLNGEKNGSTLQRKSAYLYFNLLLFLKDTVNASVIHSDSNISFDDDRTSQNEDDTTKSYPKPRLQPKRIKKLKPSLLKKPLHEKDKLSSVKNKPVTVIAPEDGDRMFFLSLVKDFKKIPEQLQLQTKAEIIQVIINAQQIAAYQPSPSYAYQQGTDQNFDTVESLVPSPASVVESVGSSVETKFLP